MNRATPSAPTLVRRALGRLVVDPRKGLGGAEVPSIVLDSADDGPTAIVTANLHGDETTGTGVVRRLDRWLQQVPFRGRVVLYPSCNPQGLRAQTRHVPADEGDLNRAFPGDPRGAGAARLADALWRELAARRPDVLADLHADAPEAIPYVIVDRPVRASGPARQRVAERLLYLAEASGLTVLREYPDETYLQFGLDRSLAGAMVNAAGVSAVTLEVGPRRHLLASAVEVAFRATLGVLGAAGVVDHVEPPHVSAVPGVWRRAPTPRTRRGGLVERLVSPGTRVRRGDLLARVVGLTGELVEEVAAAEDALVVSWVEGAWVAPGGLLGTLGVPDDPRL